MDNVDIIRAWKDEEYYNSLTDEQKEALPDNPAGSTKLNDEQMTSLRGGGTSYHSGGCTPTSSSDGCSEYCHMY